MQSDATPRVCFYFQVHQPHRLRDLRVRDIGIGDITLFDEEKNRAIFRKVAEKCYLPGNALLLKILKEHKHARFAFSLSGVFLDQCIQYGQDVLNSFVALARTGQVEFLAETYYHSLSALTSLEEFTQQVDKHARMIERLFGEMPQVFRNTELIYSNEIAQVARNMGFRGILAEGADHVLQGRSPHALYAPPVFALSPKQQRTIRAHRPHPRAAQDIAILLKHYRLSDDIAFRFSDRSWLGFPLTAPTFADWVAQCQGHTVNLFMDYETFGEHQWAETGIFQFLEALPGALDARGVGMSTPTDIIKTWSKRPRNILDVHSPVSWADTERDLTAWLGNGIQQGAFAALFALEAEVKASKNPTLLETWRRLQTSDHLYYMSTKFWNDGDVHKYFSPYDSPYEAYRRFSHALCDLKARLSTLNPKSSVPSPKS